VNLLDAAAIQKRDTIFGECFTHDAQDLEQPAASLRWRWLVRGDWKLIVPSRQNQPDGEIELYDLKSDPHESKNLASAQKEKVLSLQKELDAWWTGQIANRE
jgi:arylsulfatase A-like enzyme